jgi:hypothetical protein
MPRNLINPVDSFAELACQIAARRWDAEELVACTVFNAPAEGVVVAESLGLRQELFERHDLRVIYQVCRAGDGSRDALIQLTRLALEAAGFWSNGHGTPWCDARLKMFAGRFCHFPSPEMQAHSLRLWVPALIDLHTRARDAVDYYHRACRLLEGSAA